MKKAKLKVVFHANLVVYEVVELVNMATFTGPRGTVYMLGSSIVPREMEEIARDKRWDCTIVPAKSPDKSPDK
jgi:hypothetical protein